MGAIQAGKRKRNSAMRTLKKAADKEAFQRAMKNLKN
jgi:hypothetical protein